MSITLELRNDGEEKARFRAHLDDETVAWLIEIADGLHNENAANIAALLLRDIRIDDQAAHIETEAPEGVTVH